MNVILDTKGLEKHFVGVKALAKFSCSIGHGEILGLIGPNGAGKTTFFNIVSGFLAPDSGTITFKGVDITKTPPHRVTKLGISRTFQNLRIIRQITVLENVLLSFQQQPGEQLFNVYFNWQKSLKNERYNQKEAYAFLEEAGLAKKANEPAEGLSYGQQKLLSLACCLATKGDILLLDEPVAGIAPEMTEKILEIICNLPSRGKSVIIIEHNLDAVMQICDKVIFMDAGTKVCEGTPEEVRNDPRVIEAYIN